MEVTYLCTALTFTAGPGPRSAGAGLVQVSAFEASLLFFILH